MRLLSCSDGVWFRYGGDNKLVDLGFLGDGVFVFNYLGREIKLFLDDFPYFLHDIIFENFLGGAYNDLEVGNRIVVDIGAGVGDSAIYFVLRGAEKVIALEPYPLLYSIARRNIMLNGVGDRVVLLNAGLGSSDQYLCADYEAPSGYVLFRPSRECAAKVRIYSLDSLVKEFTLDKAILKIDCEGCEYDVFKKELDPEILRRFDQIIIEYHKGPEPIATILRKAGFEIKTSPIKSSNVSINKQGYIIALLK